MFRMEEPYCEYNDICIYIETAIRDLFHYVAAFFIKFFREVDTDTFYPLDPAVSSGKSSPLERLVAWMRKWL